METILSIIFWTLVIYYSLRLILRYLVPFLLARFVKRMQNKMSGFDQTVNTPQQEGEVKVNFTPKEQTKSKSGIGEYIDFEEINDNNKP
ncbi:MAG: hypothetical protein HOO86_10185 [Bacteroidales bacterium]|nr:hypothetical protein [Bacteroidales bacterium]